MEDKKLTRGEKKARKKSAMRANEIYLNFRKLFNTPDDEPLLSDAHFERMRRAEMFHIKLKRKIRHLRTVLPSEGEVYKAVDEWLLKLRKREDLAASGVQPEKANTCSSMEW